MNPWEACKLGQSMAGEIICHFAPKHVLERFRQEIQRRARTD